MADAMRTGVEGTGSRNPLGFLKESFPSVAVITVVIMLILPLPTVILDALMAFNLLFSLMVLLIVLYTHKPT
ncbi:MAG: FHIPEP family type III secretion protein, partial [Treponema sp.]|nr:FHIPEP family type III secretion protein [Treponema sp.]